MIIVVIDGQGGGLGKSVIMKIKEELSEGIRIIALGTNSFASKAMLKAGADLCLYGEDHILNYLKSNHIDSLIAPIGILCPGGLNGEVTSNLSQAIFEKQCIKYLIPLKKHGFYIPGTTNLSLKEIIEEIVEQIKIELSH